jgi:AraC family transcriptional regulator
MTVARDTKTGKGVELREMAGGNFAVALHEGPYATIGESYGRLFAEVAEHAIDGRSWTLGDPPSIEKYLNDPRRTKPDKLRTEIWMPVHE